MLFGQMYKQSYRLVITGLALFALLLPAIQLTLPLQTATAQSGTYSWQIVPSPNTPSTFQNRLEAVVALSPTNAWAVGAGDAQIMIQQWDGTQWSIFPAPPIPGATQSKLLGIDAAAPDDIWAVGYFIDTNWRPLAIHFDGSQWSIVPVPSNLGTFNAPDILALNSVTVIAADDVWAVGGDARGFGVAQSEGGLQLHWDGTAWTPAFPPAGTGFGDSLAAVTSVTTDNVIAVAPAPPQSYQWDGSQWTLEDSILGNNFSAVDAADAQAIMAVGTQPAFIPSEGGRFPARPISRLFNGTDWLPQSAPSSQPAQVLPGSDQGFNAVSALSANEIWAVGFADDFTMAQRWDGTQWQVVPSEDGNPAGSPNRSKVNELLGVDMLSATEGWAVGYYYDENGNQKTLIERFSDDGVVNPPDPVTTIYVSSTSGGTVDGINFRDEDIMAYDAANDAWSLFFDGSDVGLANTDVNAFAFLSDGSLLLSFDNPLTIDGIAADDSDVLRFVPTSLGTTTAGAFSLYVDGSDVGLTTNGEDIDSLDVLSEDGGTVTLLISTSGSIRVPSLTGKDEDLAQLTVTQLGNTTTGNWSIYFDGSDVGLANSNSEDVRGASLVDGDLYLTMQGAFSVSGVSGDGSDVLNCGSLVAGNATSCTFSLFLDGAAIGMAGEVLDGLLVNIE